MSMSRLLWQSLTCWCAPGVVSVRRAWLRRRDSWPIRSKMSGRERVRSATSYRSSSTGAHRCQPAYWQPESRIPKERRTAFRLLSRARLSASQPEDALEAAQHIGDANERVEIVAEAAALLVDMGDIERAVSAAMVVGSEANRVRLLARVAQRIATAGNRKAAARVVERCARLARDISTPRQRDTALQWVGFAYARAGAAAQALELAGEISSTNERNETLGEISVLLAQAGALTQALDATGAIQDQTINTRTLTQLANIAAQRGDAVQASDIAERAIAAGQIGGNQHDHVSALSAVARALAKAGRRASAGNCTPD